MNSLSDQPASPTTKVPERIFEPQLAAFEILRRLICGRPPFAGFSSEQSSIPSDLKAEVELGCLVHQVSVYLDLVQRKFGHVVSERVRTHLLLLARFDPKLEAAVMRFLESIRASDAEFKAGRFSELFEGPSADLTRYYSTLAILVLIASGCPEPRQRGLAGATGECLLAARFRADEVFEAELKSRSEVADTFEWCTKPGPFERQLQRQHDNPLFPATMRTISAQQVTEARLSDLRRISDFMNAYRTVEKEVLSPRANMVVKDASDLEKRMIDLIPSCMVLGEFCSKELNFLTKVSDSFDQEVARTTGEPGLREAYTRYMALTRIQGYLLSISVALPTGDGTEDYALRSILSEEFDLISSYANLCNTTLGTDPIASAQRLIDQAIRDGMDPALGRRKLEAFRSGWRAFKSRHESGIWAGLKRLVRRT